MRQKWGFTAEEPKKKVPPPITTADIQASDILLSTTWAVLRPLTASLKDASAAERINAIRKRWRSRTAQLRDAGWNYLNHVDDKGAPSSGVRWKI